MEIGVPKTKASVREVSLSANFSQKIIEHVKNLSGNDLVFTNPRTKKHISNRAFHASVWDRILDKCNFFDDPSIHDLRHTHGSMPITKGAPLPVIQRRLGHESITTTINLFRRRY